MTDQESLEKEINKFDRKLENLVNDCLENELSETQIYRLIEKNVREKTAKRMNRRVRTRNVFIFLKIFVITLGITSLLVKYSFTTDLLKTIGRRVLINIRPIYDWTEYHDTGCLIKNKQFGDNKNGAQSLVNCNLCESVLAFELITQSSVLANLTELISNQRPVKLSNRLFDSYLQTNPVFELDLKKLIDFYSNLDYDDRVCMFESNLNFNSLFTLISKLNHQYLPVYAQWENCGYQLRKKVRTLYEIPEFMPMMLEFSKENWFFLSMNNYKSKNFKKIDIAKGIKLAVLLQIRGSNRVRLIPKENCLECIQFDEQIDEKEIMIISTILFDIEYQPYGLDINLAMLLGATY